MPIPYSGSSTSDTKRAYHVPRVIANTELACDIGAFLLIFVTLTLVEQALTSSFDNISKVAEGRCPFYGARDHIIILYSSQK